MINILTTNQVILGDDGREALMGCFTAYIDISEQTKVLESHFEMAGDDAMVNRNAVAALKLLADKLLLESSTDGK